MRCSKGFVWTNKKLRGKKKRTDSNNTTHTTMGTLEDVEGRVSYGATRLFHRVAQQGQPLARADPAGFSPKARDRCSLYMGSGAVAGFLSLWLSWGVNSTIFTQCGFGGGGVGNAKV